MESPFNVSLNGSTSVEAQHFMEFSALSLHRGGLKGKGLFTISPSAKRHVLPAKNDQPLVSVFPIRLLPFSRF